MISNGIQASPGKLSGPAGAAGATGATGATGPAGSAGAGKLFFDWPGYFDSQSIANEATGGNYTTGYSFLMLDTPFTGTKLTYYTSGSGKTWTVTVYDHAGSVVATGSAVSTGHKVTITVGSFTLLAFKQYQIGIHCADNNTYGNTPAQPSPMPYSGGGAVAGWEYGAGPVYNTCGYTAGTALVTISAEIGHWNVSVEA